MPKDLYYAEDFKEGDKTFQEKVDILSREDPI